MNHPEVAALVPVALGKLAMTDFNGRDLNRVVDMGRTVGISTCVETTDGDVIVYARRRGRKEGCTRFVRDRNGTPVNTVVVRLYLNDQGLVALMTAYGKLILRLLTKLHSYLLSLARKFTQTPPHGLKQ